MAGPVQELASKGFGSRLDVKIAGMGLLDDIGRMDATTYRANGSQKEADCSWKPGYFCPLKTDWPSVVIECGVSQSRDRLEVDAHWWLENSDGQVKMVLVISFSRTKREIHFQQWEMATAPKPHVTKDQPKLTRATPTIMREFDLVAGVSNEASLMLNFERFFLRPPAQDEGQREGNIVFSQQELERYAAHVWNHAQ